jgi:hypothetical protein
MEAQPLQPWPDNTPGEPTLSVAVHNPATSVSGGKFIEANTTEATLEENKNRHIIPVYYNNEPVISQVDFIQSTMEVVKEAFPAKRILSPCIRLSHPIMGRVPEAIDKPASELLEWGKTVYYERMAFPFTYVE